MEKPKILLLEDDPEMRTILSQILALNDYEVTAVETGYEAIKEAKENTFDLVIADVRVEGPDGIEVINQARQAQSDVGTLVVSGYASLEETTRAEKIGVGGFLKKPFETQRFLELVQQQLQKKQSLKKVSSVGRESSAALTAVLHTLLLCLQDDHSRPEPRLVHTIREMATRVGTALQLERPVLQQVTLAAVLAVLPEGLAGQTRQLLVDTPVLLPSLSEALGHFDRPDDRGAQRPPLEARLVAAVVAAARKEVLDEGDGLEQEGLDRELVALLKETRSGGHSARELFSGGRQARTGDSLLAMAQALERAGDREGARAGYAELLDQKLDAESEVEARLGLARLADDNKTAGQQVEMATEVAAKIGRFRASLTDYYGGLILRKRGQQGSLDLLRRSVPALMRFGFADAVSLAAVALIAGGEKIEKDRWHSICRQLLAPSLGREIQEHSLWLIPDLLKNLQSQPVEGFLTRFCNLFPLLVVRLLRSKALDQEQQRFLTEILVKENQQIPEILWRELQSNNDTAVREAAGKLTVRVEGLSSPSLVRISAFGPLEVACGGETIPDRAWRTQKTKYLFAYLAYEWGRPCHDEVLLEAIWNDGDTVDKKGLYWSTSAIRRLFKKAGFKKDIIERVAETLRANPEISVWRDTEDVEQHLKKANQFKADNPARTCKELQSCLELYRGPYLEGCYYDWAITRRDHWERQVSDAAMTLAELQFELGEHREAVAAARRALTLEPANQQAHLLVMRALMESGRPEGALEQFQECSKALKALFDTEPDTGLIEFYHRAKLQISDSSGLIG